MYNLLVVDDEYIERKGIGLLLNKYNFPVNILEAVNGRKALAVLREQPVRVVITDIRMPIMDGLKLAHTMARDYPHIKVIISSAYGEFEYARQAISAGVNRYLLKPIQPQEFKEVIAAVLAECAEEDRKNENYNRLERMAEALEDFERRHLLQTLLKATDQASLPHTAAVWLAGQPQFFPLYLLLIRSREDFTAAVETRLPEINLGFPHDYLNLNANESLYFLYPARKLADYQLTELAEQLLHKIAAGLHQPLFVIVSPAIVEITALSAEYRALDEVGDYTFFMAESSVLLSRDGYFVQKNNAALDESLLNCIYEDAAYGDFAKLRKDISVLLKSIQSVSGLSHLFVKNIFVTIFGKLKDYTVYLPEGELHLILKEIALSSHMEQLVAYVDSQFVRLEELAAANGSGGDETMQIGVQQALKIIHQKYADTSLCLEYLADQVYLSPNYLSALFKKVNGLNISKYIYQYRLGKAEQLLLTTNIKVTDIGTAVGFASDSYFVTAFGSFYGTSPSKYRKSKMNRSREGTDHEA